MAFTKTGIGQSLGVIPVQPGTKTAEKQPKEQEQPKPALQPQDENK